MSGFLEDNDEDYFDNDEEEESWEDHEEEEDSGFFGSMLEAQLVRDGKEVCPMCGKEVRTVLQSQPCEATISESDPRAELWLYVLGKHSFPLRDSESKDMGPVVGLGYEGDASALTPDQRMRLIEKMMEKFNLPREEVTKVLDKGVLPIRAEGVTVSGYHRNPCRAECHKQFKWLFETRVAIGLQDLKVRGYD